MPETIGALILSAIGATTIAAEGVTVVGITLTGAQVAQVIGSAVIIAGSYAIQTALTPDTPNAHTEGQVETRQPLPARRRYYGRVKVSGPLLFEKADAFGFLCRVVAVNQGLIDGYEEFWLADTKCVLDAGGFVTNAFNIGSDYHIQMTNRVGTDDQAVIGIINSQFPTLWTADHHVNGVAHVGIKFRQTGAQTDFLNVYPGGDAPPLRVVIRASHVWDPRNPAQDRDTPATWTWSDNPVLCALDYHRHRDGMGLAPFDDLLFTDAAIAEDWIPAADICDEPVPLAAGGSEKRYRCAGGYELPASSPKRVLAALMATCDGQVFQRTDGAIGIRVGNGVSSPVTIDDRSVLNYADFRRGANVFLACNEVTARYMSPQHDYQETEADPYRDEENITETGQVLTHAMDLSWVPSHSQARRLMKIQFARLNPEWQGRTINNLFGLNAYNERFLTQSLTELGIENKSFEIGDFSFDLGQGVVSIGLSSLDGSAYEWNPAVDEGIPPVVPPDLVNPGTGGGGP
jgi:hypothetical protein